MKSSKTPLSLAVAAALICPTVSMAKETDTITITATRFATTIEAAPVNVTTITAEEIENSSATKLTDVLESQGGLHVQDLYGISGSKSSVDMSGFGATRGHNTLILINGRRLNDVDLSGANLAGIPLDNIERIEIIRGTSAVLYGDNAVGGVINIVTKSAFSDAPSTVSAKIGSFGTSGFSANTNTIRGDNAFSLSVEGNDSDGYRDNSAYKDRRAIMDISRQQNEWNYGARITGSKEESELPGYLEENDFLNTPRASTATLTFAKEWRNSVETYISGDQFAAELAVQNKTQESTLFGDIKADLRTSSFTPRFNQDFGNHHVVIGADIYQSRLTTDANFGWAHHGSSTRRDSYALYVTDTFMVSPATELTLGYRKQRVELDIENTNFLAPSATEDEQSDSLDAKEISLNHEFSTGITGFVRLAESFRFPVLDEVWSYSSGTVSMLKPQTGEHVELGAQFPLDKGHLDVSLFNIKLENEIAFDSISYSNINLDPTRHKGADFRVTTQVTDNWAISTNYGFRNATYDSGTNKDKNIPEIPRHKISVSNQVKLDGDRRLSLEATYTGNRYFSGDNGNVGKKLAGYTYFNLGYRDTIAKNWRAQVRIDNLTDKQAADAGYYATWLSVPYAYYPLPERAFYLSVEHEF